MSEPEETPEPLEPETPTEPSEPTEETETRLPPLTSASGSVPNSTFAGTNFPTGPFTASTSPPTPVASSTIQVTVSGGAKLSSGPALVIVEQLRAFLKSRLHGPWNETMLAEAESYLDKLRETV